jgi:hypothetical protein
MRLNKFKKWRSVFIYRHSLKLFIIGFLLVVVVSPFLFTLPSIFARLNFSETGQIGDTIGGLTSPVIGFLGAILVYFSFQQQLKANELQREALDNEITRSQQDRRYNAISHDVDVLREEINSYQMFKSDLMGTNAIYSFKEIFLQETQKEKIIEVLNSEPFKNFYFLIATAGYIFIEINRSKIDVMEKIQLQKKLIYLYTSKLAIYLLPIIAHCDTYAIEYDTVKVLKDTYQMLKTYTDKNKL